MKRLRMLIILASCFELLMSQGKIDDYNRAFNFPDRMKDKVFYSNVNPDWIGNSGKFCYISNTPNGKIYTLINAVTQNRTPLFNHSSLVASLEKATNKTIDLKQLTLQSLKVDDNLDSIRFNFNGYKWIYINSKDSLVKKGKLNDPKHDFWGKVDNEREGAAIQSPNKLYEAFVKNNNIYIRNLHTKEEKELSHEGTKDDYYSAYPYWSSDSKKIAVMRIHSAEVRQLHLIQSSPDNQLQPKEITRDYVKPGDELPKRTPVIFDIETGNQKIISTQLCENQMDLRGFEWLPDNKNILIEYNERGHKLYSILEIDAEKGNIRPIIEERSNTFVNYNRYFRRTINNGSEIIWMSERDNWNHLYLYDIKTAKVKKQITMGEWYVREVIDVNEKTKQIIFSASGMVKGEDPYLIRYYRINFDGKGLTCLTPEKGMHQAWFSNDKLYFVDVYSLINIPPVAVLRNTKTGRIIMTIEKADISELLKAGWISPEPFVAKGRDGKTDIYGIIVRPTNFDPTKKYPILEYIYAGPGSAYTPKTFTPNNWNMNPIAELGFIVIQLDGMGTSFRSKAFEDVCYQNLKDAGFPDRIAWTRAAAEKYSYMDTTRIGIFGASAGGQESMAAVLFHPEHYKAAYASCGCHDNRMDKIWWNEQWMGYPIGKQYEENSNVVNAHLLKRPLMLVVGEMDDNVDPSSTYQVCNALIKANKNFELVVLPGVGHTMGNDYGEHKRYDFFVKNLMDINAPTWTDVKKR